MRRRSETINRPTEMESASTWVPSMMGKTQIDSRMDVPMSVSCSHWHMLRMDIYLESSLEISRYYDMQLNDVAAKARGYKGMPHLICVGFRVAAGCFLALCLLR